MKKASLRSTLLIGVSGLLGIAPVYAGIPVWTFSAPSPANVTISAQDSATVVYTVTNHSRKSKNLLLKPTRGLSAAPCLLPRKGSTCNLIIAVKGSQIPRDGIHDGPVLCEAHEGKPNPNQCYRPSAENSLNIHLTPFSSSVSNLALSINGTLNIASPTPTNAALKGNPRQIIITNTSSSAVRNVTVNPNDLPQGTQISPSSCGTMPVGGKCVITVTPGAYPNNDASNQPCTVGTEPVAGSILVNGDGVAPSSIKIYVLGYGCQYQGGFIFAIDDNKPKTGSIGGTVISLVDQESGLNFPTTGIVWSSNGKNDHSKDFTSILGIDETSTPAFPSPISPPYPPGTPEFEACKGVSDGKCNTRNIVSYYNHNRTKGGNPPTPLTYYAAGLCKATINNYTDWYLPAYCELGTYFGNLPCIAKAQNVYNNLNFLIGDQANPTPSTSCSPPTGTQCIVGLYWSSTEVSDEPQTMAWVSYLDTCPTCGPQHSFDKGGALGVRCARNF